MFLERIDQIMKKKQPKPRINCMELSEESSFNEFALNISNFFCTSKWTGRVYRQTLAWLHCYDRFRYCHINGLVIQYGGTVYRVDTLT